jgi:hypothetical protein
VPSGRWGLEWVENEILLEILHSRQVVLARMDFKLHPQTLAPNDVEEAKYCPFNRLLKV